MKINMPNIKGPWEDDMVNYPKDLYTFIDLKTGYQCEIKRTSLNTWCGYVYYCSKRVINVQVHGGITYNDGIKLGFDTNHYGDLSPAVVLLNYFATKNRTMLLETIKRKHYWTFEEVKEETERLAYNLSKL